MLNRLCSLPRVTTSQEESTSPRIRCAQRGPGVADGLGVGDRERPGEHAERGEQPLFPGLQQVVAGPDHVHEPPARGRAPAPGASWSSRMARCWRISRTDSAPTHPAISSMASGRPSSRRQSSPMACGGTSLTLKLGSRSRARATNSCTASDPATSAAPAAADGQSSGGTVQHTSPGAPSTTRLVTTMRTPGAALSSWLASAATASRRCSAPSSTMSRGAPARAAATESGSGTPAWSGTRRPAASTVISVSGWRTVSSGRNVTGTAGAPRADGFHGQPGLACPTRADQGQQPGTLQQADQFSQLTVAADEARLGDGQCGAGRAAERGRAGGSAAAGVAGGEARRPAEGAAAGPVPAEPSRASKSARAWRARADIWVRPVSQRFTVANDTPSR